MRHSYRILVASLLALVGLSARWSAAADTAAVHIESTWIRWLPGDLPAGGYLTVINDSAHAITLLGASSSVYADISLHRSVERNGTAQMVPIDHINVAAHSRLAFATAGYHLMLARPRVPVQPGRQVPVTLQFKDAPALTASFDVRPPNAVPSGSEPTHSTAGNSEPGMSDMPGMTGGH